MREGWTHKIFEDCICKVSKPKQVQTSEYDKGSRYPIISQEDKLISGYCDDESMLTHIDCPVVVFGDHTRVLKYIDFDFVVGADGVKIIQPKNDLDAKFLYYYLKWYNVPSLGYSRHYKLLKEIQIPLPPIPQQRLIVSELDEINSLLALKREQLKKYDELAQSLFYEMFGDPVENEKGWVVKKFKDILKMKSGDGLSAKDFKEGIIPVYGGNGISGYHNAYNKDGSYIIIGRVGVYCGNVRNVSGRFWLTDNAFELIFDKEGFNDIYLSQLLNRLNLRKYANAAAQPVISNTTLKDINIPLPPLSLQRTFAQRIEQIEEQKKQVTAAIAKLETLLASRMQYWFE